MTLKQIPMIVVILFESGCGVDAGSRESRIFGVNLTMIFVVRACVHAKAVECWYQNLIPEL